MISYRENLSYVTETQILNGQRREYFFSWWIISKNIIPINRPTPTIRTSYIVWVYEPSRESIEDISGAAF
jgi:hypothetical protein